MTFKELYDEIVAVWPRPATRCSSGLFSLEVEVSKRWACEPSFTWAFIGYYQGRWISLEAPTARALWDELKAELGDGGTVEDVGDVGQFEGGWKNCAGCGQQLDWCDDEDEYHIDEWCTPCQRAAYEEAKAEEKMEARWTE